MKEEGRQAGKEGRRRIGDQSVHPTALAQHEPISGHHCHSALKRRPESSSPLPVVPSVPAHPDGSQVVGELSNNLHLLMGSHAAEHTDPRTLAGGTSSHSARLAGKEA